MWMMDGSGLGMVSDSMLAERMTWCVWMKHLAEA